MSASLIPHLSIDNSVMTAGGVTGLVRPRISPFRRPDQTARLQQVLHNRHVVRKQNQLTATFNDSIQVGLPERGSPLEVLIRITIRCVSVSVDESLGFVQDLCSWCCVFLGHGVSPLASLLRTGRTLP